jgi:lipopolysaccharide/colanic/teichoic acid biosynthesis glycosyltransferase
MYRRVGKRLLDLLIAVPALVLLAPVLGLVALLVRISLGTPILFRQRRPGFRELPFTIIKFRTMTDHRDELGRLLPDRLRLTRLGRFLRSTSLDELPELWNVVRGDMSLVGPRPLHLKYLPYYTREERQRFELLPGITGWAQVNGRNMLGWDARLACDVWYAEHCSALLDLKILGITVLKVLRRADVQVDPKSCMANLDDERRAPAMETLPSERGALAP